MYLATIYPDRISVRYERTDTSTYSRWARKLDFQNSPSAVNLQKKKETFELSYQSRRKIIDTSNLLIQLSKPRTVQVSPGKFIYNFRASFVTLTLPHEQIHSDIEIKKCLNNFLTTLRTVYAVKNYIWKAELQKNENIHFHLILDQFIPHQAVRYYWNKALNTLGYVDRYREEWEPLSFQAYAEKRGIPKDAALNAWLRGVKSSWKSPPTEKVMSVNNMGQIGYYIAKYLTKQVADPQAKEDDLERVKIFGRVWARSQSLSAIKILNRYDWESMKDYIQTLTKDFEGLKKVVHDYCTVYYFDYKNLTWAFRRWLKTRMNELGITFQYPFPHLA